MPQFLKLTCYQTFLKCHIEIKFQLKSVKKPFLQFTPVTLLASSHKFTQYFPLLVTFITHLPKGNVTTAVNSYILLQVCHTGYFNSPALPQTAYAPEPAKMKDSLTGHPQKGHRLETATPKNQSPELWCVKGWQILTLPHSGSGKSRTKAIPDGGQTRTHPLPQIPAHRETRGWQEG